MIIAIDDREKKPYTFEQCKEFYAKKSAGEIKLVQAHLPVGDYSLVGREFNVAIERKSLTDLYNTLGQHRKRFEHEVMRLSCYKRSAILIESTVSEILHNPPERSRLHPHSVLGTCLGWSSTYKIPFVFTENREEAEMCCFIILSQAAREKPRKRR